jgi:hypothetical protein
MLRGTVDCSEKRQYKETNVSSITFLSVSDVWRQKASAGHSDRLEHCIHHHNDASNGQEEGRETRQGIGAGWAAYTSGAACLPSFVAQGKRVSTNVYISLSACPNFLNGVPANLFIVQAFGHDTDGKLFIILRMYTLYGLFHKGS